MISLSNRYVIKIEIPTSAGKITRRKITLPLQLSACHRVRSRGSGFLRMRFGSGLSVGFEDGVDSLFLMLVDGVCPVNNPADPAGFLFYKFFGLSE